MTTLMLQLKFVNELHLLTFKMSKCFPSGQPIKDFPFFVQEHLEERFLSLSLILILSLLFSLSLIF